MKGYMYNKLRPHIGHNIECVCYGYEDEDPIDICIECTDCNEVLVDAEVEDIEADMSAIHIININTSGVGPGRTLIYAAYSNEFDIKSAIKAALIEFVSLSNGRHNLTTASIELFNGNIPDEILRRHGFTTQLPDEVSSCEFWWWDDIVQENIEDI